MEVVKATRGRDLSPLQVEAILNRLLQDYPEAVSRWAMGLMAEPPEEVRCWLLSSKIDEEGAGR